MADYNNSGRSFIHGLSDFWNLYFKEFSLLETYFKGAEIQIGQTYLDLLALLLNNSVQDAPLFNKEFFKLLLIRETDIRFHQGLTSGSDVYSLELPDNIVEAKYLNNRILEPTASLDLDTDYRINSDLTELHFAVDPTNAYYQREFGSGNGGLRIRSRLSGSAGGDIRINLSDTGGALAVQRTDFDITITYDGPANASTTTVLSIVQALNLDPAVNGLILAEVVALGTGTASVAGTGGFLNLERISSNPLDGFSTRKIELAFGGSLVDAGVTDWVDAGVQKGDVLRIIDGAGVGQPREFDIVLVRGLQLYTDLDVPIPEASEGKVNYAVLRSAEDNLSESEALANSGASVQSGADGSVDAVTREFTSPTASFVEANVSDIIEIVSPLNSGSYRILEFVNSNTVVLSAPGISTETPVNWSLLSVLTGTGTDGVFTNAGDGTATFTSVSGMFIASDVGTVLRIVRAGVTERYEISEVTAFTDVVLSGVPTSVVDGIGLAWGLANTLTAPTQLVFSPPIAWPESDNSIVVARRELDNTLVTADVDYSFNEDTGVIRPLTVWRTSVTNRITYNYKVAVVENVTAVQSGLDGTITSGTPNTFSSPTAAFDLTHVGYAIQIQGSALAGNTNNGIHYIEDVLSATSVELSSDRVVSTTADPGNGALTWSLLQRGSTEVEDITAYVDEMSFWIPDALVDRFQLYNTYGYLINRFERSSESYRSLIRGIFQLFMLGPTLERFESAINTVAGLPVVRNDDEILLDYDNGATQTGTDGFLDFTAQTFTSATAQFYQENVGHTIYIVSGTNENKQYNIASIIDINTVLLDVVPSTDGPIDWELTATATQTITTDANVYTVPRRVPVREEITDPANFGVLTFRAFAVLTDVFNVTDYVETPQWWEFIQIPEEVLPNQSSTRRQSTSALFENVVGPADDGRIGDPGFIIGADSEGFIAPSTLVRDDAGALDGELFGDPLFPTSSEVFFESPTAAFTSLDRGSYLVIDDVRFLITVIVSSTRVQLQSFLPVTSSTGLDWEIQPVRYLSVTRWHSLY